MKKKNTKRVLTPYLLILPTLIFYLLFWITPVLTGVKEVFTDLEGNFTLLGNFQMMFSSELFSEAFVNTAIFAIISVLLQFFLALILAVILNQKFPGSKIMMFIAMIPMAVTPTAVAILWKTGLIKEGWINSLLMSAHLIDEPIVFMNASGIWAVMLIVLIDTWTVTPSVMIILTAGLQGIQTDIKEAAYTFGASKWQIFKDVTLPMLKPSIVTAVILRIIAAIQVWNIAVMVLGYNKAPFLVERVAFYVEMVPGLSDSSKLAFTISFFTTVIVMIVTAIYLRVTNKQKRNEVTL